MTAASVPVQTDRRQGPQPALSGVFVRHHFDVLREKGVAADVIEMGVRIEDVSDWPVGDGPRVAGVH